MPAVPVLAVLAWQLTAATPVGLQGAFEDAEDVVLEQLTNEVPAEEAVIQNRRFRLGHEVSVLAGVLPADPYAKGLTLSVGYTYHLTPEWAVEVIQATGALNIDTKLKQEVLRFRDERFPSIVAIFASHLIFKPMYGKEALFNTDVVHLELFGQLGPALVLRDPVADAPKPGLDLGVGTRLWLDEMISVRLDLGELIYVGSFRNGNVRQALHIHLGVGLTWSGDR